MKTFARSCLTSLTALSLGWWIAGEAAAQPAAAADAAALEPSDVPPEAPPQTFGAPGQTMSCEGCYEPRYAQPYGYTPQLQPPQLTAREWAMVDDGEISGGRHAAGVLFALSPGFGLGQAVQGRWSERGWIFTFGEAAGIALAVYGASQQFQVICDDLESPSGRAVHNSCEDDSGGGEWMLYAGLGTYAVLHIWEIVDAISGPVEHNRQVRALRRRAGLQPGEVVIAPFLVPSHEGGAMAGLSARF